MIGVNCSKQEEGNDYYKQPTGGCLSCGGVTTSSNTKLCLKCLMKVIDKNWADELQERRARLLEERGVDKRDDDDNDNDSSDISNDNDLREGSSSDGGSNSESGDDNKVEKTEELLPWFLAPIKVQSVKVQSVKVFWGKGENEVAGEKRDDNDTISSGDYPWEYLGKYKWYQPQRILDDDKLFNQPPPNEECPICMVTLPTHERGSTYYECCGKMICVGCMYSMMTRTRKDRPSNVPVVFLCAFCRTPSHSSDEDYLKRLHKRIDADDAMAIYILAHHYRHARHGLPQDSAKALELFVRAGELGHAGAYCNIGYAYEIGAESYGIEKDMKKSKHYYALAAMEGDVRARHNLGVLEEEEGNFTIALKHFMIATQGGDGKTLKKIQRFYSNGHAMKCDYAKALRSYQDLLAEIKSVKRDEAAAFDIERYRYH